jgi:short-subunit dehydrogenase
MAKPVAVITGASSGIGLVFARRLARDYDLILVARRWDRLQQVAEELRSAFGAQVELLQADLTADEDLMLVMHRIAREEHLALLVNNAGFGAGGPFWETSLELQEQMHRLHITATLRLTHVALNNLVTRERAADVSGANGASGIRPGAVRGVINVASVAAFLSRAGSVSYGATKAWMTAFTEGLAMDLKAAGSGVRVQALCPGYTYSEFHDTMGIDRKKLAGSALWMTPESVVDASLAGFAENRLYVVPGWRYQALVGILPRLPVRLRMAVLSAGTKRIAKGSGRHATSRDSSGGDA